MRNLSVILFLIFISCDNKEKDNVLIKHRFFTQFNKEYNIKGEQILFDNVRALGIYQIGDFLLTSQVNDSLFFNIFNKKDLKFIKSFGPKEGPNAYKTLSFNRQYLKENDSLKIWLYDIAKSQLLKINLSKIIHNPQPDLVIENKIDIDRTIFPAGSIFYINDSVVVGTSGLDDYKTKRLESYNSKKNKIINETELFPKVSGFKPKKVNLYIINDLYHCSTGFKNNQFVLAMDFFNRIDIFDLNLKLKKTIIDRNSFPGRLKDISQLNLNHPSPLENSMVFYADISLGSKFIYALYYNQLNKDYSKPKAVEVRVFDWEGNPRFVIKIPEYLMNISVDEKEGYIYGVAYFEEKIMRYDIKKILNDI